MGRITTFAQLLHANTVFLEFYMFASFICIVLFLSLPFHAHGLDTSDNVVGLAGHTLLSGGRVRLAAGSIVATEENIGHYRESFKDAHDVCDVEIDGYGDIVLHYKNSGTAKKRGCTVDLFTNEPDRIKLVAGVRRDDGVEGCLKACDAKEEFIEPSNYNKLPFVYSKLNKDLIDLDEGPAIGDSCRKKDDCVQFGLGCLMGAALELGWSFCASRVHMFTHPIGEMQSGWFKWTKYTEQNDVHLELTIKDGSFSMKIPTAPAMNFKDREALCVDQSIGIFKPQAWEIQDANKPDKGKPHLLVFHLLPQKAIHLQFGFQRYEGRLLHKSPNGPVCDMYIKFSRQRYSLLILDEQAALTAALAATKAHLPKIQVTQTPSFPDLPIVTNKSEQQTDNGTTQLGGNKFSTQDSKNNNITNNKNRKNNKTWTDSDVGKFVNSALGKGIIAGGIIVIGTLLIVLCLWAIFSVNVN